MREASTIYHLAETMAHRPLAAGQVERGNAALEAQDGSAIARFLAAFAASEVDSVRSADSPLRHPQLPQCAYPSGCRATIPLDSVADGDRAVVESPVVQQLEVESHV